MVSRKKLDAAGRARAAQLIVLASLLAAGFAVSAQNVLPENLRIAAARKAFDSGDWEQAAKLARGPESQSADLDFLEGLAEARLQHWSQSRLAFKAGHRKLPDDPRFLVELAGVSYKEKNLAAAKCELREALREDSQDPYTLEFLGSIYFLEGNLDAALKYWNRIDKPRLRSVSLQPEPQLNETLLSRAVDFNAPQVLTRDALRETESRLDNLGIFPQMRMDLAPATTGTYDATLHVVERNGWGDSKLEGAISLLSGAPYSTIYPEFDNLGHRAVNVTSLLRWDSEKRRAYAAISTPIFDDPGRRLEMYVDARNENWNLTNTLFAGGLPLSGLNIRRISGGAEVRSLVNSRWSWTAGIELANRSFRNLQSAPSAGEKLFFTDSTSFAPWLRSDVAVLRAPELRFTVDASAEARFGRTFADGLGAFGTFRGSLKAEWFPQAKGDDYEIQAQVRAADTQGNIPFDELFQLGIERDNDLWLRGHAGTFHGRKGSAPLGRRYFLANWDFDKKVYSNGIFSLKLGPFLDNGTIADPSGLFGSQRWLWDTGALCKIRVLSGPTIVLTYGRDLRGGHNVVYGTVLH